MSLDDQVSCLLFSEIVEIYFVVFCGVVGDSRHTYVVSPIYLSDVLTIYIAVSSTYPDANISQGVRAMKLETLNQIRQLNESIRSSLIFLDDNLANDEQAVSAAATIGLAGEQIGELISNDETIDFDGN